MISDSADEYFADGMTEEIISTLSKIHGLKVISRTSVMQYKGASKSARAIGQDLKVGSALEGSVRKAGKRLRLAVQLIDTQTDENLWSESYDKELEDVFGIQRDIANRVAESLKIRLLADDRERIEKIPTENMDAYVYYWKGRFYLTEGSASALNKAIDHFSQAIKKDSKYAPAYAGLSSTYSTLWFIGQLSQEDDFSKVRQFATRALELDNSLAEPHLAMAAVRRYDWDWSGAEMEVKKAIELNPNLAQAHSQYSRHLLFVGRVDEAVLEVERALELDPLSAETSLYAGTIYLYANNYDTCIEHLRNAIEIDPNIVLAQQNLGFAHVCKGMLDQGIAEIEKAVTLSEGKTAGAKADLAYAYAKAGKVELARRILEELVQSSGQGSGAMTPIAGVYSILGEKDEALNWLQKAYDHHSIAPNIKIEFWFENIRSDPRFRALLKKMGLP